jgi:quercetin dioxygenase-like cupin family protein
MLKQKKELFMLLIRLATFCLLLIDFSSFPCFGQAAMRPCASAAEQTDDPGPACFTTKQLIGELPGASCFWYLYTFSDRSSAEAAKDTRSTVVESFGKVWLFAVAESDWKSPTGTFVARLGPLTTQPGVKYEAVFMQSIFAPGMTAPLHTHSGMEAFYTLTGDTCLETSEGVTNARGSGNIVLVQGGLPMLLMATGKEKRRGVVLILHDSTKPPTTLNPDWKPKGLCHP